MKQLDRQAAEEYGIPSLLLMETAGQKTFARIASHFGPLNKKPVLIVAGEGNNGGDGLVLARALYQEGFSPTVFLVSGSRALKEDARIQVDIYKKIGGEIIDGEYRFDALPALLAQSHLIADAIFGTGLSRPVEGKILEAVQLINRSGKPVIALDIPSGVSADSGWVLGDAVKAEITVTYGLPKKGHFLFPGASLRGKLFVEDIGIPETLVEQKHFKTELMDIPFLVKLFPKARRQESHKGTFGHLLVIAGSRGKRGAGALCCKAALRSGAGLVTWALPQQLDLPDPFVPEAMTLPLPQTPEGTPALAAEKMILSFSKDKDGVAIGPGLSTQPETGELIKRLLVQLDAPIILDADGLNLLAGDPGFFKKVRAPLLLTPHPGELARLLGTDVKTVLKERLTLVAETAEQFGCSILLKGAYSLIANPDREVWINPTGNPGMATAGTGDVLTGIIAGLCVQGLAVLDAARIGAYLHGLSGDLAAGEKGEQGLIAGDLIEKIPEGMQLLAKGRTKNDF